MKKLLTLFSLLISLQSFAGAPPGDWVELNLSKIEVSQEGWFAGEAVWFASPTSYVTQFNCQRSWFVGIKNEKLADRTLSMALYAKATGKKVLAYVTKCDSLGHPIAESSMLRD